MEKNPSLYQQEEKRTVLRMLTNGAALFSDIPYTCQKGDGGWECKTYSQVLKDSRCLASGLKELGFCKGDKIGLLS